MDHSFGGDWTEQKLRLLDKYLRAYTKIMSRQPFKFAYIDAFAGTGYRTDKAGDDLPLLQELESDDIVGFKNGSAKLALLIEPHFNTYIFVEKSSERAVSLQSLKDEFSDREIHIRVEDANEVILDLCSKSWQSHRAVLFLDPYGMEVKWSTIEAISRTEAIDLWYLFPLGIAVNRMLTKSGQIPQLWQNKLDNILGGTDWRTEFYEEDPNLSLFGHEQRLHRTADTAAIQKFFLKKLRGLFPAVAANPRRLHNSKNSPLYLLCFAAANKRGGKLAVKIAQDIMNRM